MLSSSVLIPKCRIYQPYAKNCQVQFLRRFRVCATAQTVDTSSSVDCLNEQLKSKGAQILASPKMFNDRVGLVASQDIQEGQDVMVIDGNLCATVIDAQNIAEIKQIYEGDNELTLLSLWLCFERQKQEDSQWSTFIQSLPDKTASPVMWSEEQVTDLLQGSAVFDNIKEQRQMMEAEWAALLSAGIPGWLDKQKFINGWSVCLQHFCYLQAAECIAMVPLLGHMKTTANNNGCTADYDPQTGTVVVKATRPYRQGQEVMLNDPSSSGEVFMRKGYVDDKNAFDYIYVTADLVQSDKLYRMKKEILQNYGLQTSQQFPIMEDRIPLQLLSYLRLSRISDAAQIAKISFDKDVIISQNNEYEILQLLMAECRDRLSAYKNDYEYDVKLQQQENELSKEEKLACQLRLREKVLLGSTMDAVRRRLAPIRGIPTKSGKMADPNQDLQEIFDTIENLPQKPKEIIDNIFGWDKKNKNPESFR
eukprot:TRINITY_DN5467_c0_g2_i1.p1 TRINITY_DN5467_c0_g2~~TRINITY_DN5467_c0_g2_i1.p1  ORF type:complete len:478 (-),score=78.38 TRINITY_DN5467_c0_g2_i1:17-1450(-)